MRTIDTATRYGRILPGITIILLIVLISACGSGPEGKIEIVASEFDFGTVPNTDPMTRSFKVRNTGDGLLDIIRISTSCSCTTATISKKSLGSGEDAELAVTFDPDAHNGATGQFMRKVFIESTDPENPETVFTFRITVVEK